MSEKTKLPVVTAESADKAPTLLPTGKQHVSYSEISDWMDCSYRHHLKHIKKIELDKPSIHTEYGRAIHDALEQFLVSKNMPTPESVQQVFEESLAKLKEDHNVSYPQKEIDGFSKAIPGILSSVPSFLDEEFPGWSPHAAELALMESIDGQDNKFKGFIDSIIRIPRSARRSSTNKPSSNASTLRGGSSSSMMRLSDLRASVSASMTPEEKGIIAEPANLFANSSQVSDSVAPEDYDYCIIDWKTTSWGWAPDKKRDYQKQLQLILYKHFFCKIMGLPLDRVKCGFVLLKRTPRKSDNSCTEFVSVSVGPKTEEKGLRTLHDMINQMKTGRLIKNRASCRYCVYNGTSHCT